MPLPYDTRDGLTARVAEAVAHATLLRLQLDNVGDPAGFLHEQLLLAGTSRAMLATRLTDGSAFNIDASALFNLLARTANDLGSRGLQHMQRAHCATNDGEPLCLLTVSQSYPDSTPLHI